VTETPQPKIAAMVIVSAMFFGVMAFAAGFVWLVGWAIHK
jgi:hypothetical protein